MLEPHYNIIKSPAGGLKAHSVPRRSMCTVRDNERPPILRFKGHLKQHAKFAEK